ncbi:MAG: GNAT family N-acetyltransferase [Flavobacteriales bacterium]|nr:GNAT family N-acetyltransferase [Candidatus Arcticimaribacter sp.]
MDIIRTDQNNVAFQLLVRSLNQELSIRDGKDHMFYSQFNGIENLKNVVVAYVNDVPVGCGAFKTFDKDIVEIKRMYTNPEGRQKGVASAVLRELETWMKDLKVPKCILETGKNLPEAVALYRKFKYQIIPNYEPYQNTENSICFEKKIL